MRWHRALPSPIRLAVSLALVAAACAGDGAPSSAPDAGMAPPDPPDAGTPEVVATESGAVRGITTDGTRRFFAIPYAAPPVGALRWQPPAPATSWDGIRDATGPGAVCPQLPLFGDDEVIGSEDCLLVNVFTPTNATPGSLPVMVWLHGGAFEMGSNHEDGAYDGSILSREGDVVVVTVNYRVGALGFLRDESLATPGDQSAGVGNYGLLDQRAALRWVRDNVRAFGGDPTRVTLFGESAGGMSVCAHLAMPESRPLFHGAIIQSGPCGTLTTEREQARAQADALATAVGCTGEDRGTCLRAKPVEDLVRGLARKPGFFFQPGYSWGPVIDGALLTSDELAMVASGEATVPVLIGTNRDEGALFVSLAGRMGSNAQEYAQAVRDDAATAANAPAILSAYPVGDYDSPGLAQSAILGDRAFHCPTRRTARALSSAGATVFLYHFEHPLESSPLARFGVAHTAELPFVFGNEVLGTVLSDEEQVLAQTIRSYWLNMARFGDPNGGASQSVDQVARGSAVRWPPYDATDEPYLVLRKQVTAGAHLHRAACDFWDSLPAL